MGQRGPVPAPDNVRALRGMEPLKAPDGAPAKRLVLAPKAPKPPADLLDQLARAEWNRVVPELNRAGVLSEVDRGVLVSYCMNWSIMVRAWREIRKGLSAPDQNGGERKSPLWQVYREAQSLMLSAANMLYLTPTARLRIPVPRGAMTEDDVAAATGTDDPFD